MSVALLPLKILLVAIDLAVSFFRLRRIRVCDYDSSENAFSRVPRFAGKSILRMPYKQTIGSLLWDVFF